MNVLNSLLCNIVSVVLPGHSRLCPETVRRHGDAGMSLRRRGRAAVGLLAIIGLFMPLYAVAATAVDLGVTAYTWTPTNPVRGGTTTFTVKVSNNDTSSVTANSLTLTVDLPSNVDFSTSTTSSSLPSGCSLNSGDTTLTCTKSSLAALTDWSVTFKGLGSSRGVATTQATISAAGNTDPNSGNDTLSKNVTVIFGADLTVGTTGTGGCTSSCSTAAGSTYTFYATVTNNGPDPATTFQVTDNLPSTSDFTYQSYSGSNWSCSPSGSTVTCNYSGSNIASGSSAPTLSITGKVITSAGSITNGASVATTDSSTGDPVDSNNGPSQITVSVTPGTDLQAYKTMTANDTGLSTFVHDEAVTATLSAKNTGTQTADGVTLTDTISSNFTIGTLPGGCSSSGQQITCNVGTLGAGATSSSFAIPLTVVSSPTLGSDTNTVNVSRTSPSGTDTAGSANYSIVAPFAHLTLTKTKTPTPVANGATVEHSSMPQTTGQYGPVSFCHSTSCSYMSLLYQMAAYSLKFR